MFLVPACIAFSADTLLLYLYAGFHSVIKSHEYEATSSFLHNFSTIQNIIPFAIIRILLLIPLNYHTYSGTRIKFPILYYIFHSISLFVVLLHVFGMIFANSDPSENIDGDDNDFYREFKTVVDNEDYNDLHHNGRNMENNSNSVGHGMRRTLLEILLASLLQQDNNDSARSLSMSNREHLQEHNVVWTILSLSLISIVMHAFILLHVRSSAPVSGMIKRKGDWSIFTSSRTKDKRKLMAYWVFDKYRRNRRTLMLGDGGNLEEMDTKFFNNGGGDDDDGKQNGGRNRLLLENTDEFTCDPGLLPAHESFDDNGDFDDDENDCGLHLEEQTIALLDGCGTYDTDLTSNRGLFVPSGTSDDNDMVLHNIKKPRKQRKIEKDRNRRQTRSLKNLVDGYDDFLLEVRSRFQLAKRNWTARLDDVTMRIHNQNTRNGNNGGGINVNNFLLNPGLNQFTPFEALLQLYAYEEVFSNHKLDRAFSNKGKESDLAISFYAPQLLCFLLHNAFLNSGQLEKWILDKCHANIYFAHRCFWFLRSWCLRGAIKRQHSGVDGNGLAKKSSRNDFLSEPIGMGNRTGSGGSLGALLDSFGKKTRECMDPDVDESYVDQIDVDGASVLTPSRSAPSVLRNAPRGSPSSSTFLEHGKFKFTSEEYQLLEGLLSKVVVAGENAAEKLQYGEMEETGRDESNEPHSSSESIEVKKTCMANENGFIPVDPKSGCPSMAHLNAATSTDIHGFIPRNMIASVIKEETSCFFRTPHFLDALIGIADDLMEQPRSKRTSELQRRLRLLEVEMLPSNAVYIPFNDCMHRVWRIVSSESIALSTKERVPCIICLEVVDMDPKRPHDGGDDSDNAVLNARTLLNPNPTNKIQTDAEILAEWYKKARRPQRHNNLFSKVTRYSQMGLKKLRDDIEDTIQHQERLFRSISNSDDAIDYSDLGSDSPLLVSDMHLEEASSSTSTTIIGTEMSTKLRADEMDVTSNNRELANFPIELSKPPMSSLDLSQQSPSPHRRTKDGLEKLSLPVDNYFVPIPSSSIPSSRASSRPSSPGTKLGQWMSPTQCGTEEDLNNKMSKKGILKNRMLERIKSNEVEPGTSVQQTLHSEENKNDLGVKPGIKRRFVSAATPIDNSHEYGATENVEDIDNKKHRKKLCVPNAKPRPPPIVFKEDWNTKQERLRSKSAFGNHPNWRLLPLLIKSNDDLRQEQLASQLIHCMASILAKANVPVWLYPYEIIALTYRAGIIEAIPDTISIDSLRKNYPDFTDLKSFFEQYFGSPGCDEYENAKANFIESLAAYSIVCFLLQIKDRHNGNILLNNKGHLIHIDFGFFFLSSPGKNSGFESAPFKLTRDFVDLMDGPNSRTFGKFRDLCYRTFLELRKKCYQITLLVEMLAEGNEDLGCFCGRPIDAVYGLQERFRLDLNDKACIEYVNLLVDNSLENWRTSCYDRYQRFCVGIM